MILCQPLVQKQVLFAKYDGTYEWSFSNVIIERLAPNTVCLSALHSVVLIFCKSDTTM